MIKNEKQNSLKKSISLGLVEDYTNAEFTSEYSSSSINDQVWLL